MLLSTLLLGALLAPSALAAEFAKAAKSSSSSPSVSKEAKSSSASSVAKASHSGGASSSSSAASAGKTPEALKVAPYHRPTGPLDTPWTAGVPTKDPWPLYPRPQMRRPAPGAAGSDVFASDWLNLNGLWAFQGTNDTSAANATSTPKSKTYTNEILVPYCMEGALSGIMERNTYSWYRTDFLTTDLTEKASGARILLNFQAVDYEATVFVNGKKVGFHRSGYNRFTFDISDYIYWDGTSNVLEVFVFDPTDTDPSEWDITVGKQTAFPSHIFYTPCSGIWQTVWLETVPQDHITFVSLKAAADGTITSSITVSDSEAAKPLESKSSGKDKRTTDKSIKVTFLKPGTTTGFYSTTVAPGTSTFQVPKGTFELWTPDEPNLYNVTVQYKDSDAVQTYVGFRTVSQGKVNGVQRPLLNGEFLFQMGPLDQGFWPDGIYTAPTYDAMVFDLEYLKKVGWNMLRKHIKVEPDLFYEATDRLGLLVWQDQPCLIPSAPTPAPANVKAQFEAELKDLVILHEMHPSIVAWITINEGWGESTTDYGYPAQLVEIVRSLDTSRLVDAATGWFAFGAGDFSDNHHYSSPQCGSPFYSIDSPPPDFSKISVQGEFGGIGLNESAQHLWKVAEAVNQINQTYELDSDKQIWNYRALRVIAELKEQIELFACSAGVYTQTTDVEGEVNGLLSYDRRVARPILEDWQKMSASLYAAAKARGSGSPPNPLSVIPFGVINGVESKRGFGVVDFNDPFDF